MARLNASDHGGNVYAAARALRCPLDRVVDFSASINPLGASPRALRAIIQARRLVQHYPDPECVMLRRALATHWHCNPDQIVVGNGSTELIHLLPSALRICHLLVLGPTFSEYANAILKAGGKVSTILADRTDAYAPPIARAIDALCATRRSQRREPRIDAVVLCNPNSPTGQSSHIDRIKELARVTGRRGVWLIIDETFAEYCEERSILPSLDGVRRVIVLRSFTKFFGLPGLRAGYLVTKADTARRIRAHQAPWSVNTLAQTAAAATLQDIRHARHSRSYVQRERARFSMRLGRLPGCIVFPSYANFLLLELPRGRRAQALTSHLGRRGLLIRDCSSVPGLNNRTVRIAVKTKADNDRLVRSLWKWFVDAAVTK